MRGFGRKSSANFAIRSQVVRSRWLRRLSERRHRSDDAVTERVECTGIRRHCVIREEAANDLAQPLSLFWNRLVPAPSHLLLHLLELCSHAVAPALALEQEAALDGIARR